MRKGQALKAFNHIKESILHKQIKKKKKRKLDSTCERITADKSRNICKKEHNRDKSFMQMPVYSHKQNWTHFVAMFIE